MDPVEVDVIGAQPPEARMEERDGRQRRADIAGAIGAGLEGARRVWYSSLEGKRMKAKTATPLEEDARAPVFLIALGSLPGRVRSGVLREMLAHETVREEVEAMILWYERRSDRRRPLRDYLQDRSRRGR